MTADTEKKTQTSRFGGQYAGKYTGPGGSYDVDFLRFCEAELPDAFSFWVMDIDSFVIRARSGKLMLLEIKRNGYACKPHQLRTIQIINRIMTAGIRILKNKVPIIENGRKRTFEIDWKGYNVLTLSGESFANSQFKWNGRFIEKHVLIKKLAMAT